MWPVFNLQKWLTILGDQKLFVYSLIYYRPSLIVKPTSHGILITEVVYTKGKCMLKHMFMMGLGYPHSI